MREMLFARSEIYDRKHAIAGELFGNLAISFSRPLLRCPASAWVENDDHFLSADLGADRSISIGIVRKLAGRDRERSACDRFSKRMILLNHMFAGRIHLSAIQQARWSFARMSHSYNLLRSRKSRHQRGLHRTLKVASLRVLLRPNTPECMRDLSSGIRSKQRPPPSFRIQNVNRINQRSRGTAGAGTEFASSRQQF